MDDSKLEDIHIALRIIQELVQLYADLQKMVLHEEAKKVKEAITLLIDKFDLNAIKESK